MATFQIVKLLLSHNQLFRSRTMKTNSPPPPRIIEDKNISWKAKGLFTYLSRIPSGQYFDVNSLAGVGKDQLKSIYSGLKELVDAGYVDRITHRNEDGTFSFMEYVVCPNPLNPEVK